MEDTADCIIVGAGPAGLTAAIYLARFRLKVAVFDSGRGRAALIPCTRNHAGFPDGIAGSELLARMRHQAAIYGANIRSATVGKITHDGERFLVEADDRTSAARTVLLATGVTNRRPNMPDDLHDTAVAHGNLRYCPVCDGYEVTDQRVAVIGTGRKAVEEAEFVRSYTADVTIVAPEGPHGLDRDDRNRVHRLGIELLDGPIDNFVLHEGRLGFDVPSGSVLFDSVYPALGSEINSGLAADLGARRSDEGCITVDRHQRTSVSGLYAAGDVVLGLDQISHAMGEAGVAAVAIRNDLAAIAPLLRR